MLGWKSSGRSRIFEKGGGGGVTNVDCSPKSEVCYILTHSDHSINSQGHALPSTIGSEN